MDRQVADGNRTVTLVTCADCGRQATVPFVPTQGRPVYCGLCHQRRRDFAKGESAERLLRATSRVVYDASWGKEGVKTGPKGLQSAKSQSDGGAAQSFEAVRNMGRKLKSQ